MAKDSYYDVSSKEIIKLLEMGHEENAPLSIHIGMDGHLASVMITARGATIQDLLYPTLDAPPKG